MDKSEDRVLRDTLVEFLRGASAHADFDSVVKDFPAELRGKKPKGAEHSAWQLLEHIRLALHDLYDFSVNPKYASLKWPDDYWPKEAAPPSDDAWNASVRAVKKEVAAFEKLIGDPETNFSATIPWGEGQTILREVLLAGQHTSYHLGQLVSLRRELGAWGSRPGNSSSRTQRRIRADPLRSSLAEMQVLRLRKPQAACFAQDDIWFFNTGGGGSAQGLKPIFLRFVRHD